MDSREKIYFPSPYNEVTDSGDVSMGEDQNRKLSNLRACQSCRVSKVRCDQPNPGMPCTRCQKSGKPCIDATGLPGKHLNNRILEIESRIESLLSSAELQDNAQSIASNPVDSPSESSLPNISNPRVGSAGMEDLKSSIQSWLNDNLTPYIDDHTTETIFSRFMTIMAPMFPVVVFPPGTTAAEIRNANPILFLSILDVASSGYCAPEIERKIRKMIVQTYVHCMLRTEQYTLGLLQALIVSATWHRTIEPVEPGEQMDIYQISHTAANMALIMRLGESLNAKSWGTPMFSRSEKTKGPASAFQAESLEARRAWLGCHYICSNTSMSLHAPNVMRWTRTMDECLEVLETSPVALPSDKVLCRHIRLQHIIEEFAMQLSAEETSSPDINQAIQREVTHRASKRQLDEWYRNVVDGCWDGSLEFSYHFSRLYISEVAHCTATSDAITSGDKPIIEIEPHAITEFMDMIDNVLRVFTSLDMSTIRALPAMYLIRFIYTFIILVKLHFAVTKLPNEDALKLLPVDRLQVSQRLDHVLQMFAGWGPLWPATKLTTVFLRMRSWFENEEDGNRQSLPQTGSWLTLWNFKPTAHNNQDTPPMNIVDGASDDGSMVAASSHCPTSWVPSLASTDVVTLPSSSWLDPSLVSDISTALPPFDPRNQPTEDCFPHKEASDARHDEIQPGGSRGLSNPRDIEHLDDAAGMNLDWSQFSNMGLDLCDLNAPFSPVPNTAFGLRRNNEG